MDNMQSAVFLLCYTVCFATQTTKKLIELFDLIIVVLFDTHAC